MESVELKLQWGFWSVDDGGHLSFMSAKFFSVLCPCSDSSAPCAFCLPSTESKKLHLPALLAAGVRTCDLEFTDQLWPHEPVIWLPTEETRAWRPVCRHGRLSLRVSEAAWGVPAEAVEMGCSLMAAAPSRSWSEVRGGSAPCSPVTH